MALWKFNLQEKIEMYEKIVQLVDNDEQLQRFIIAQNLDKEIWDCIYSRKLDLNGLEVFQLKNLIYLIKELAEKPQERSIENIKVDV